ncbi:MAG: class I SAM-dependent methyltransferase [Pirellulales bacterium]
MTLLETLPETQTEALEHAAHVEASACPLCGGTQQPWLALAGDWRRPTVREGFRIERCTTCDYGSLVPRPAADEIGPHYAVDNYYTHHAPQDVEAMRSFGDRLRVRLAWQFDHGVESELNAASLARRNILPAARVCDIGCGNGGMLRRLAGDGYEVAGMDPDADACKAARAAGLDVVQGTAEQLPAELAAGSFDVVTMMHVLEHVLQPTLAVQSIASLLKSGGRFIVETPNNACLGLREAGITWRWLDVPRHLNFFTPESLQAVCRAAGLEIEAVEFTGFTRQFQYDWLADEQEIHGRLKAMNYAPSSPLPPRNSAARAWRLLAKTWRAPDALKYDSVRVIARKA